MAFVNPFSSPMFKWIGFPFMLICAGLLAWSIWSQSCGPEKARTKAVIEVGTSTTP